MKSTNVVLSLGAVPAVVTAFVISPTQRPTSRQSGAGSAELQPVGIQVEHRPHVGCRRQCTTARGTARALAVAGALCDRRGTPTIRDLRRAAATAMGNARTEPDARYQVTTGVRRMSNDQANAFASLGIDVTPEVLEKHKWGTRSGTRRSASRLLSSRRSGRGAGGGRGGGAGAEAEKQALGQGGTIAEQVAALQSGSRGRPGFNPNPNPPGFTGGRGIPLPRKPEEIRRGVSVLGFLVRGQERRRQPGSHVPGMKLGIFDGNLRFTVYRGTNLLQMDAIARTNEPSGRLYDAGLKGFSTATMPRVTWRDTGGHPQQHQFGGPKAIGLSAVRASNRCCWPRAARLDRDVPSAAHVLLHARSGRQPWYVFYRNDGGTYSIGVTMPEAESDTFPSYEQNYALYNAPPGTWQKMQMFFYAPSRAKRRDRRRWHLRTTTFSKAVPGYKTFVNHFHLRVVDRMRVGGFDTPLQDLMAMKAIGLNVIGLSDFHADSLAANDHGPPGSETRRTTPKRHGASRIRTSWSHRGKNPASRSAATTTFCGRRTYWSKPGSVGGGRGAGAAAPTPLPFTENDPTYGKVYHTGNADKVQQLLDAENGHWYHAHPRTNPRRGSLMRPGAPSICRTIGISAWRSNRAWGRTTRNRRCVRGAASMPSTR